MAEQVPFKHKVTGSSPVRLTSYIPPSPHLQTRLEAGLLLPNNGFDRALCQTSTCSVTACGFRCRKPAHRTVSLMFGSKLPSLEDRIELLGDRNLLVPRQFGHRRQVAPIQDLFAGKGVYGDNPRSGIWTTYDHASSIVMLQTSRHQKRS